MRKRAEQLAIEDLIYWMVNTGTRWLANTDATVTSDVLFPGTVYLSSSLPRTQILFSALGLGSKIARYVLETYLYSFIPAFAHFPRSFCTVMASPLPFNCAPRLNTTERQPRLQTATSTSADVARKSTHREAQAARSPSDRQDDSVKSDRVAAAAAEEQSRRTVRDRRQKDGTSAEEDDATRGDGGGRRHGGEEQGSGGEGSRAAGSRAGSSFVYY
ncbi:hypothetical protein B0H11DRAFT_2222451 [Mycena galericulata]|nr:hypothetical protein B0H11DRAFT_2222451 [Mycena galericulata]